jgi:O-antigen ligase
MQENRTQGALAAATSRPGGALMALLLVTLFAVPLALAPSMALSRDPSGVGTPWLPAMLMEGLAAALVMLTLWRPPSGTSLLRRAWRVAISGVNAPILLLLALATLSRFYTEHPAAAAVEWSRLAAGVAIYFVVARCVRDRRALTRLATALLILAIVVAVGAVALYGTRATHQMEAWLGNTELVSGLLVLLAPLAIAVAFLDPDPARRVAGRFAAAVILPALLLTQTRSAWLGLAVGLFVLALAARRTTNDRRPTTDDRRRNHSAASVVGRRSSVGFLVLAGLALFLKLTYTAPTLAKRAGTIGAPQADASFQWRLKMWDRAVKLIAVRPLTGWGLGSFPIEQSRFDAEKGASSVLSLSETAHNEYLQVAAELGLPGLAITLWVLGAFFVTGARALPLIRSRRCRMLVAGSIAAIAAQSVDAAANPAWRFADVSLFFWLLLGIGVAACATDAVAQTGSEEDAPARGRSVARKALLPAALLLGLWRVSIAGAAMVVMGQTLAQARSVFVARVYLGPESRHDARASSVRRPANPIRTAASGPPPLAFFKSRRDLQVHVWPIPPEPGARPGQHDWRDLFQEASVPQWRYALSQIDVLYLNEQTLSRPVDDPTAGLSDEDWTKALVFCRRHKLKIAIVRTFGTPLADAAGPEAIAAELDARRRWFEDVDGGGEPRWRRLAALCDRNRVPRSIVVGLVLDSPYVHTFGAQSQPPSPATLVAFARQLHQYVGFAQRHFPTVRLIEQEPYLLRPEAAGNHALIRRHWQAWANAYRTANGKAQANLELGVDLGPEAGSIDDPASPARSTARALAQLQGELKKRGIRVGIQVHAVGTPSLAQPDGGLTMAQAWARAYLTEARRLPAFLSFVPARDNGPDWALPEAPAGPQAYHRGTLMRDVREVLRNLTGQKDPPKPASTAGVARQAAVGA